MNLSLTSKYSTGPQAGLDQALAQRPKIVRITPTLLLSRNKSRPKRRKDVMRRMQSESIGEKSLVSVLS